MGFSNNWRLFPYKALWLSAWPNEQSPASTIQGRHRQGGSHDPITCWLNTREAQEGCQSGPNHMLAQYKGSTGRVPVRTQSPPGTIQGRDMQGASQDPITSWHNTREAQAGCQSGPNLNSQQLSGFHEMDSCHVSIHFRKHIFTFSYDFSYLERCRQLNSLLVEVKDPSSCTVHTMVADDLVRCHDISRHHIHSVCP